MAFAGLPILHMSSGVDHLSAGRAASIGVAVAVNTYSRREFPWVLKSFLGNLVLEQVTNGPLCNEHGCRQSAISSVKLTYHLPRFLMRRYLKFAVYHNPLDGPNISIGLPRSWKWQHKLFKYAVVGDVRAIQNLFSKGDASPYDVNPRGCNALIYAVAQGNPQFGRSLLQAGADPEFTDSNGRKPIELFAERALAGFRWPIRQSWLSPGEGYARRYHVRIKVDISPLCTRSS